MQGHYSGVFASWAQINAALPYNTWHHVALRINASACSLQVNGATVGDVVACNITNLFNWGASSTVSFGGFQGMVADVRVSAAVRATAKP